MRDYFTELSSLANDSPLSEVCGFLLIERDSLCLMPARNMARDIQNTWMISEVDYSKAIATGRLFGLYHSHVLDDDQFSKEDKRTADLAELPMLLYSLKVNKFNYYRPLSAIRPYENRAFILGVQDCGSILTDYYARELGVEIAHVTRFPRVIEEGFGDMPTFFNEQFYVVEDRIPQKHDFLVFSIRGNEKQNHVGVYLGDNLMLHQLFGRPSSRQELTSYWSSRLKFILRLRNFTSKVL